MREAKALHEIAQDMVDWCLVRGCQKLRETDKEISLTCPNLSCPSRDKGETHKSFDINKHTALYHCWHCGLKGIGLNGPKGLITQLKDGNFIPSATIGRIPNDAPIFFKPKERIEAQPIMSREEVGKARAKGICDEAATYFTKRGIPEIVFRDHDLLIFSYPKGKQLSFMKQPLNDTTIFFPVRNDRGEVIHVHYKLINGGYYMSPGPKPIYLTKEAASSVIVVVEGVFDALSVYTVGYQGAALLGHEITSNHDLSVFESRNVVLMLDNDEPGKLSVEKVALVLASVAKEVRIAEIPAEIDGHKGKDANDILVTAGAEKLKQIIQEAKTYELPDDDSQIKATELRQNKVNIISEDKPKKESIGGILFPKEAWRGLFETYRQAQDGTTEAPEQYHFAVFKTVAGIVVGRTAYVWSGRKLFPNFYSVIIGPTTRSRKSTAAGRGTSLIADIDEAGNIVGADPLVLILRGLSTPAGLLAQLKTPNIDEEGLSGIEYERAMSVSPREGIRALIVINEFASLLRQAKKEAGSGIIQLLTDAYDCLSELHNPTKVDPHVAKNAVVSMICLSTRDWLESTLDITDVYGGYVCRNLFYDWMQTSPIPNPAEPNQSLLNEVTMKLQGIRRTYEKRGKQQLKYQFDIEAQTILDKWYMERWYREYLSEVIAAATQRIDENVRKLALLYAVLENKEGDLYIHANQLRAAIKVGEYWEATAIQLFSKFGFSKEARDEIRVLEVLSHSAMSIRDLGRKTSLTSKQVGSIVKSLVGIGSVQWINEKYTDTLGRQRTRKLLALTEER
jgi:hypothetical protein